MNNLCCLEEEAKGEEMDEWHGWDNVSFHASGCELDSPESARDSLARACCNEVPVVG